MRSLFLLFLLLAPSVAAQPIFDVDRLDDLFERSPKIEVNLRGGLLGLAAAATEESEPELSTLIRSLNAITVRVYPLRSARPDLDASLTSMLSSLESDGWYTMVRVRADPESFATRAARQLARVGEGDEPPDDEDVWVYVRDRDDAFDGLAVVVLNRTDGDATFVHIDGFIAADQIGRLTTRFGDVDINIGGSDENDDD